MGRQNKPIHLVGIKYGYECNAVCDGYTVVTPIEATILFHRYLKRSKGTFNPKKVTCKRCLKHSNYKEAMDKIEYPLFFLKDNG